MADALATAVQTQVAAWKENRKLFPGWLIAPHQSGSTSGRLLGFGFPTLFVSFLSSSWQNV